MTILETQGLAAKHAERVLAVAGTARKNAALESIAQALCQNQGYILAENEKDLAAAMAAGMKQSLLDRLALSSDRIDGIVEGVRQVAALPDPIGQVTEMSTRPNGLIIGKRRVPLGVIGIIYEARPNVTVDAAALCLKSGNAVILRGGKEAFRSNKAFVAVMRDALESAGLPRDCVALVEDTSRESANELMGLTGYLDVLIPRGGAGLIRAVVENARVPVIETGVGVCHVYVDARADLDMAARIIYNAKCSRPSVCNAAEVCLVDAGVAGTFLPRLERRLVEERAQKGLPPVELRLDQAAAAVIPGTPAGEEDFDTEFLDYILAVKVVSGVEEAAEHIAAHSTGHSEAIVTDDPERARRCLAQVDSAAVYWNASTRFTDGGEFGLGCEMGISTQKLHARGPLGLGELCSYKYVIQGTGQTR